MFTSENEFQIGWRGPKLKTVTTVSLSLAGHPLPWFTRLGVDGTPEAIIDADENVVFKGRINDALHELVQVTSELAHQSADRIVELMATKAVNAEVSRS